MYPQPPGAEPQELPPQPAPAGQTQTAPRPYPPGSYPAWPYQAGPGPYAPAPLWIPEPPEAAERRELKRCGNVLGGAFCLSQVGVNVLQVFLILLTGLLLKDPLQALDFFDDPIITLVLQLVLSILMFTVPFLIGARMLRRPVSELVSLHPVKPSLCGLLVGAGLMVCMTANFATNLLAGVLTAIGLPPVGADFPIPSGAAGTALYLLTVAAAPALLEEFALRGVVLGALRRHGDGFAILVSAALFGLMHGNLVQIPFAFLLGLLFGWIAVVTDSLWPCILIHFCNNLLSGLLSIVGSELPAQSELISIVTVLAVLLIGLYCLARLILRYPGLFRREEPPRPLTLSKRIGAFAGSAGIVCTIILYGLAILEMQSLAQLLS